MPAVAIITQSGQKSVNIRIIIRPSSHTYIPPQEDTAGGVDGYFQGMSV